MNRPGLGLGIAAVLGGVAALMASAWAVYNPVFFGFSLPFAAGAVLIWLHATGRLADRVRTRGGRDPRTSGVSVADDKRQHRDRRRQRRRGTARGTAASTGRPDRFDSDDAREILGVDGNATDAAIRQAYRDRVKEAHPDAPGGSADAFKRVTDAYEHLAADRP